MELTIEQALQQGVAAHKEGKVQDAEKLYRAILQSQPTHPDANHNLGLLAVSVNKADVALPLFKAALEANPKMEQFWLSYINALIKEKQFDNARQVLEQAKKQGVAGEKINVLEAQLASINKQETVGSLSPSQEQLINLLEYYKIGRLDDAEKLAVSVTEEFPQHQLAWKVLGAVLKQAGRITDSLTPMQKSVQLAPLDAEAHSNLGVTLKELGSLDKAEASYRRAIVLKPDYAEAHYNLGNTLKELGRLDEAEAIYRQAIVLKSDYAEAHSNLGDTLQELGRLEEAEASYKQAIVLKPDFASAKHMLAALTGETTATAPLDYVESLFDNYAAKFETSLVENLEYKIPRLIAEIILKDSQFDLLGSIIDIGCGTGLFGMEIKQFCEHLEGIDLSQKMLVKAKEKNVYNKLIKQDIVGYLSNASLNFDYFISLDVFVYIGDLSDVFRLIKSRNKTGGKLAFSTEDYDGDGFFLEQSGRYSHSKKYIESLCKKFSYKLLHFETQNLRKEKNKKISGGLYLLEF
jgi:predicted TPR repeat methyltransferase